MADTDKSLEPGDEAATSTELATVPSQAIELHITPAIAPRQAAISKQADDLVTSLLRNPHDRELSDAIANIGLETQDGGQLLLERFNVRTGELAKMTGGREAAIDTDLGKLRTVMDMLNPYPTGVPKVVGFLSFLPSAQRVYRRLKEIGAHAETINTNIKAIVGSLNRTRDGIAKDDVETSQLRNSTDSWVVELRANEVLAGMVYNRLLEAVASTDASQKKPLTSVLYRAMHRNQSLLEQIEIAEQCVTILDQQIDDNDILKDRIATVIATAPRAIIVALAIKVQYYRQRSASTALDAIEDYTLSVVTDNAKELGRSVEEVRKQIRRRSAAVNQLLTATQLVLASCEELDRVKMESVNSAKPEFLQLQQGDDALRARRESQLPDADVKSIEAVVS